LHERNGNEYFLSKPSESLTRRLLGKTQESGRYLYINLEDSWQDKAVEVSEDETPLRDEKPPLEEADEESEHSIPDQEVKRSAPGNTILGDARFLCARCGRIGGDLLSECDCDTKLQKVWITFRQLMVEKGSIIKTCPSCGAQKHGHGSILQKYGVSDDAAGAVLTQAIMEHIPDTNELPEKYEEELPERETRLKTRTRKKMTSTGGEKYGKKRLLVFSDSRQDASYFSVYLQRTSDYIMHRQLILRSISQLRNDNPSIDYFSIKDIVPILKKQAEEIFIFKPMDQETSKMSRVACWLHAEAMAIQPRQSLEGVGLLCWSLNDIVHNHIKDILIAEAEHEGGALYGFTAFELTGILETILHDLRRRGVISSPQGYNVSIRDTYFWPRNRPYTMQENSTNTEVSIASWLPLSRRNVRSDYIDRIMAIKNTNKKNSNTRAILELLWDVSREPLNGEPQNRLACWEVIENVTKLWGYKGNRHGTAWRLRDDIWGCILPETIVAFGKNNNAENVLYGWFICDKCGVVNPISVHGVCPTYRCEGTLKSFSPEVDFADNHYRYLYQHMVSEDENKSAHDEKLSRKIIPVPIISKEHTAQITTEEGARRQEEFIDDMEDTNVLSCSTTFELGVDVGQLHSVFLRNVPPTTANYVQRAGRAGRRLATAAFIVTYARNRPHDLSYFDAAQKLVTGHVETPRISLDNEKIARRHLHAVVLSRFWKKHPERFNGTSIGEKGKCRALFFKGNTSASYAIREYLMQKYPELFDEIGRIFTGTGTEAALQIDNWEWINRWLCQYFLKTQLIKSHGLVVLVRQR